MAGGDEEKREKAREDEGGKSEKQKCRSHGTLPLRFARTEAITPIAGGQGLWLKVLMPRDSVRLWRISLPFGLLP